MKIRKSFVSNSSSCSFVVCCSKNNVDKVFDSIEPLELQELWHGDDVIKYDKEKIKEYISKFDNDEPFTLYLGLNDCNEYDVGLGYMVGRLLMNGIKCYGNEDTEWQLRHLCSQK